MAGRGCKVEAYKSMMKKAAGGKVQTSADTARKLATEMGGMRHGGRPTAMKKGGSTVKIDLEQAARDTAARDAKARAAAKARAEAERYRRMMGSDADILRRGERSQALDVEEARSMGIKPVKRAKGSAGKVRKGMMTPGGDIKKAVKPKKGIGGIM